MKYVVLNNSESYLFERGRDKVARYEEDLINLIKEVAGYLAGYYEKKSNSFWNKLFGNEFLVERNPDHWLNLSFNRLTSTLLDIQTNRSLTLASSLFRKNDEIAFSRNFVTAVRTTGIEAFVMEEEEYKIIFL